MHVLSQGNNINSISDGNMLPPDAQDYFKSSIRKRSLITSLCMIPYVAWIPGLFVFVNSKQTYFFAELIHLTSSSLKSEISVKIS